LEEQEDCRGEGAMLEQEGQKGAIQGIHTELENPRGKVRIRIERKRNSPQNGVTSCIKVSDIRRGGGRLI